MSHPNVLRESGRPLFFKVNNPEELGIDLPAIRLGDVVRLAVRSLSVMQKEALVLSPRTGAAWRLASDEGAYLEGHDEAPCPLSFLSTGMVSSYMEEILALAKQRGIEIRDIVLCLDNFYTMKGSALKGTMTGGAEDVRLEARIHADADDATLRALVYDAVAASPLNGLMRGEKDSLFSLTHNGEAIGLAKAKPVAGDTPPCPDECFERAEIAEGDWSGLVAHSGQMSPRTEETVTLAGGSLTDEQDRRLHVQVTCRLGEDGVKRIEQRLFNPHGSIFHFLSSEDGRAPDAASYIAAGIGFCFMTQFGRYAKIVGKPLSDYRILQDFHFSLGGASGGTGKAGQALPLETHCHLTSTEDDDYARTCLDMAEQTCFLHAFCRTDLKARVKVSRVSYAA
ncbi:MAG TPA: hypothetical protein VLA37_09800 [Sphingomonadaceae bacterium]|nr:hypothetical protein [Sphingomonadaceae bacterium]